ncbi:hypothetical protein ACHAQJ_007086 [Trichoderma viride]
MAALQLQITSQPSGYAKLKEPLSPITAKQIVQVLDVEYWATAVLLSSSGVVVEVLHGTKVATGIPMNGTLRPQVISYSFTNLTISSVGTFNIRLDVYKTTPTGATLVSQNTLSPITVGN